LHEEEILYQLLIVLKSSTPDLPHTPTIEKRKRKPKSLNLYNKKPNFIHLSISKHIISSLTIMKKITKVCGGA
jgi:hypothetical protein